MTNLAETATLFEVTSVSVLSIILIALIFPIFAISRSFSAKYSNALRQTHFKLGVPTSESHLRNQRSVQDHQPCQKQPARIQSLYVYPIKSCCGVELQETKVLPKGFELDRLYSFAQLKAMRVPVANSDGLKHIEGWEVLTLRQNALLANIKVDVWLPNSSNKNRKIASVDNGYIVVRVPWRDPGLLRGTLQYFIAKACSGKLSALPEKEFVLPIEFPTLDEIKANNYHYTNVKIFANWAKALNMGAHLSPELALYLGVPAAKLTLLRINPERRREVFGCAPKKNAIGYQPVVEFQDEYPVHLISLSSLHSLESKIIKDDGINHLDVRRFRPNIIISGSPSFDEDHWRIIQFKHPNGLQKRHKFDVSCRAVRCKLPNVDPVTGTRHKIEPDRTLRKYRDIDDGAPKKGCMGMQLCPLFERIECSKMEDVKVNLEVGMEIEVLFRGSHHHKD